MKEFIKPNYQQCNVNISATLAEFLGAPNTNATLPLLKEELAKGYEKIVFICFDGMGIYPLQQNLPQNDFLRKHVVQTLTSTFPSTTTAATTSLKTNRLPLEHGWLGWSVNFPELGRNINVFKSQDSWTEEIVEMTPSPLENFPNYFDRANTDYEINTLFPHFVEVEHPERNTVFDTTDDFFEKLESLCHKEGKQFIYAYCSEPDHFMHQVGVTKKPRKVFEQISKQMEDLAARCKDTLFVVTADHGQVDVKGFVYFWKDKKMMDMLEIYPYLEPRAAAFKVKKGCEEAFEKHFEKHYKKYFVLTKSADLIAQGYFGNCGDKGYLLGDYIALGNYTHKLAMLAPPAFHFKGHHTGLTEEMEVPLILISCK